MKFKKNLKLYIYKKTLTKLDKKERERELKIPSPKKGFFAKDYLVK